MTNPTYVLVYISGIPLNYCSKHLRKFFQIFVESEKFVVFHFRHRPEITGFSDGSLHNINFRPKRSAVVHVQSLCSFCILRSIDTYLFDQYYNNVHWMSTDSDEPIESKCKITVLTDYFFNEIPAELTSKVIELRPPSNMPQGNIGTPLKTFLKTNQSCTLPVTVIKHLGLNFFANLRQTRYSCIPYDYDNPVNVPISINGIHECQLLTDEDYRVYLAVKASYDDLSDSEELHDLRETQDDELEEWERFEVLHGDAYDVERSGNCMLEYEKEQEVTWEKGGPGMVLYTDQAFWRDLNGIDDIFDEAGNWDFDVETENQLQVDVHHSRMVRMMDRDRQRRMKDMRHIMGTTVKKRRAMLFLSKFPAKFMNSLGWKHGQSLGVNSIKSSIPVSDIIMEFVKHRQSDRAGIISKSESKILSSYLGKRTVYYGSNKNVPISYFVRFVKAINK